MSAVQQVLADLEAGHRIGTDNRTGEKYGTNKIPDIIYKLRRRGIKVKTHTKQVKHRGTVKQVAEYSL